MVEVICPSSSLILNGVHQSISFGASLFETHIEMLVLANRLNGLF